MQSGGERRRERREEKEDKEEEGGGREKDKEEDEKSNNPYLKKTKAENLSSTSMSTMRWTVMTVDERWWCRAHLSAVVLQGTGDKSSSLLAIVGCSCDRFFWLVCAMLSTHCGPSAGGCIHLLP